jgi:predicted phosphate transport protein (TIGR00153 family)
MRFLPRQEKFFKSFLDQARIIESASQILFDAAREGGSRMVDAAAQIRKLELEGDDIIHDIFIRLNRTFITPLDPEDIHSISSHLDDVLDGIEDAAHRMVAYQLDSIAPAMIELCEIIHKSAIGLRKALDALERSDKLLDHCIEVNHLEGNADGILRRAIADLFQNEKDPIALIKKKEIYEFLEATTDCCEDVADILQAVIVKNS